MFSKSRPPPYLGWSLQSSRPAGEHLAATEKGTPSVRAAPWVHGLAHTVRAAISAPTGPHGQVLLLVH